MAESIRAKSMHGETKVEPNLTSMLDLVFNLIAFFTVLVNFSEDAYDRRVRLPVAGSARPIEAAGEDRLTLNIDRDGNLLWSGQELDLSAAKKEIALQVQLIKYNARAAGREIKAGDPLPATIVIRADRDTPYVELMDLITTCQAQGFQKFALKAMYEAPE